MEKRRAECDLDLKLQLKYQEWSSNANYGGTNHLNFLNQENRTLHKEAWLSEAWGIFWRCKINPFLKVFNEVIHSSIEKHIDIDQ